MPFPLHSSATAHLFGCAIIVVALEKYTCFMKGFLG